MSTILAIDIGAGTMDILWYDTVNASHFKAVVKSPVACIAEKAARLPDRILLTGTEMGGGDLGPLLKKKAGTGNVVMSESSATTIHHSRERVTSFGIQIVPDLEAEQMKEDQTFSHLTTGDLEPDRLRRIIGQFGIPFKFDLVGICAQDHGVAPEGVSHLDYRHTLFKKILKKNPEPQALLYSADRVPQTMNRLNAIAATAQEIFKTRHVFVMDSGMAAVLGASMDPRIADKQTITVMDIATSHTVGATLQNGILAGFFEYHTHAITRERLEALLRDLAEGNLQHRQILEEGGHGAYIRTATGFDKQEALVATGPRRRLLKDSSLPILFGAPLGDNMMTGTVGLLEALRRNNGMEPILYL